LKPILLLLFSRPPNSHLRKELESRNQHPLDHPMRRLRGRTFETSILNTYTKVLEDANGDGKV